jgi:hemerythrin-like domain-containing protein
MLPAGPLMIEHRLIERMISALNKEERRIEQGGSPDVPFLEAAIDFLRIYADRCHHGKEEDILFSKLATKSMTPPMKQAMERLIEDHALARSLVGQLDRQKEQFRSGDGTAAKGIARTIAEIARLYPDHIAREDREFFPTAMTYLEGGEREEMLRAFEDFDRKLIHEKYRAVVEGVEKR